MASFRLSKNDSATTAFVMACLFEEVITIDDLRNWADHVLNSAPHYPDYIVDLSLFNGYLKDLYGVIGFVPDRELSDDERLALLGIAYARGRVPIEPAASHADAAAALNRHPEIELEFEHTFPFLPPSV